MNAWPVDMLQPRDVYVADHFGLKTDGPSIGDNVGNAIYARSGNGIVYDGAVRDINGLEELPNFISFVRSYDPSHHFGSLASGSSSQLDHGQHQWSHAYRACDRHAGRRGAGQEWRGAFYPAPTRGRGGKRIGIHPSARHLRAPAPGGEEIYRRADRRDVDSAAIEAGLPVPG